MKKGMSIRCFLFLLTPLREGRPQEAVGLAELVGFLLTPLREGRPLSVDTAESVEKISTHAPAGGATGVGCNHEHDVLDFYSRPCGRGDPPAGSGCTAPGYFYSRPCGRGDAIARTTQKQYVISTHAPAGGATRRRSIMPASAAFLLTPLREGRHELFSISNSHRTKFLLTPLREGRQGALFLLPPNFNFYSRPCGRGDEFSCDIRALNSDFYSRPCGRGDIFAIYDCSFYRISTHAPAGGATYAEPFIKIFGLYFYSRPCGRGDADGYEGTERRKSISTHAPAGGATGAIAKTIDGLTQFLLTPLREGRRHHSHPMQRRRSISTHAPAGGATQIARKRCLYEV